VELKLLNVIEERLTKSSSNRTKVELKQKKKQDAKKAAELLIVPKWN